MYGKKTVQVEEFENDELEIKLSSGKIIFAECKSIAEAECISVSAVITADPYTSTPDESYCNKVDLKEYQYKLNTENENGVEQALDESELQEADMAVRKWATDSMNEYFGV